MSNDPLSADVIAVRGDRTWWIFDVGACDEAVQFINELPRIPVEEAAIPVDENGANLAACNNAARLAKNVVISHFHRKNVVMEPLALDDGVQIQILPMPNSHAKGSLALIVDDFVFLGDATYPMVGHGAPDVYNVQILGEQIKLLKSLTPSRFCLSHKRGLVRDKTSVIQFLESVYARRQKNENYIVA